MANTILVECVILPSGRDVDNNRYRGDAVPGNGVPVEVGNIIDITDALHARVANYNALAGHIVVFPEFALQPQNGFYTDAQATTVRQLLTANLRQKGGKQLVVYGSMISERQVGGVNQYCNEVLYGRGAPNANLLSTYKYLLSNIDLLSRNVNNVGIHVHHGTLYGGNSAREWYIAQNDRPVFNWLRQRIGISVCLDYSAGANRDVIPNDDIDIHIVPCAGMRFYPDRSGARVARINFTKEGGHVIICDAFGSSDSVHKMRRGGLSSGSHSFKFNNIDGIDYAKVRATDFDI